jgi:ferredoxin--NADP+ reductase
MTEWVAGQITDRIDWTESLLSLRIRAQLAPYQAWQFVKLGLDIGDTREARPFSFVNAPNGDIHEFYFIKVPGGLFSTALHSKQPGATVWLDHQANGFFTLAEVPAGNILWLLATGTALGPFLSILQTATPWARFERIILCHAVRNARELTYRDTIDSFRKQHAGHFIYVPFVSRETTDMGCHGRIPDAIADGRLERHTGITLTPESSQIMICGNPAMVADTIEVLKTRGFQKNLRRKPGQITVERYWDE